MRIGVANTYFRHVGDPGGEVEGIKGIEIRGRGFSISH